MEAAREQTPLHGSCRSRSAPAADPTSLSSADSALLLLVRHCEPHEGHPLLPGDPPLTEEGGRHARHVAEGLARVGVDRIVSSPQRRALETAQPLSDLLDRPIEVLDALAEVDRHTDRYRSPGTIRAEDPDGWAAFLRSPPAYFGLDEDAYRAAVLGAIDDLAGGASRCVAVFSHGTPIKMVVRDVLGLQTDAPLSIDYGSVTHVVGRPGRLGIPDGSGAQRMCR